MRIGVDDSRSCWRKDQRIECHRLWLVGRYGLITGLTCVAVQKSYLTVPRKFWKLCASEWVKWREFEGIKMRKCRPWYGRLLSKGMKRWKVDWKSGVAPNSKSGIRSQRRTVLSPRVLCLCASLAPALSLTHNFNISKSSKHPVTQLIFLHYIRKDLTCQSPLNSAVKSIGSPVQLLLINLLYVICCLAMVEDKSSETSN